MTCLHTETAFSNNTWIGKCGEHVPICQPVRLGKNQMKTARAYDTSCLSIDQAKEKLRGKPPGTYLIYQPKQRARLEIVWVDTDHSFSHLYMFMSDEGFLLERNLGYGRRFCSLQQFTKVHKELFSLPLRVLEARDKLRHERRFTRLTWEIDLGRYKAGLVTTSGKCMY